MNEAPEARPSGDERPCVAQETGAATHPHLRVRAWGLLTAGGAVACTATLLGYLGRFSWWLDLFSHFRVQYLVGLLVLGLLFLVVRWLRTAAVFLVVAGCNFPAILPLYFGGPASPVELERTLKAMLLNVSTDRGDPQRVKKVIQRVDPDVVVLEEINSQWLLDLRWLADTHEYSRARPREDNFGIGLFSKHPLSEDEIAYIGDAGVPTILATVETDQGRLRVVATHPMPPAGASRSRFRNEQLEQLPEHTRSSLPVILLGDLNVTPWNHNFRRLVERSGLVDSSRGHGFQPSWPSNNTLLFIPLDRCLHSSDIAVVSRVVGPDVGSDHYPLTVEFVIMASGD